MTVVLAIVAAWAMLAPIMLAWLYVDSTDAPTGDRSTLDILDNKNGR